VGRVVLINYGEFAGKLATITAEPLERGFGLTLGNKRVS